MKRKKKTYFEEFPDLNIDKLRSRRTKNRLIKEDKEKFILKQHQLWDKLYEIKRNIALVPLEKPYQKGFVRYFVLREDIARSKYAEFFQGILDKINTFDYSDNRKFTKRKKRRRKKIEVPREQSLQKFREEHFPKFGKREFSAKEQAYFIKVKHFNSKKEKWEYFWEFREKWMFELRVKPNMITHYKPVDCELESQIHTVGDFLDRYKNRGIYIKKFRGHKNSWSRFEKEFNLKEKYHHLEEILKNFQKPYLSATEIAQEFDKRQNKSFNNEYLASEVEQERSEIE